jgi:hypothetical protein
VGVREIRPVSTLNSRCEGNVRVVYLVSKVGASDDANTNKKSAEVRL